MPNSMSIRSRRNVFERGDTTVQRITPQPTDHGDVAPTTREAPEEACPAVPPSTCDACNWTHRSRPVSADRSSLTAHESDGHRQDAEGDENPEERRQLMMVDPEGMSFLDSTWSCAVDAVSCALLIWAAVKLWVPTTSQSLVTWRYGTSSSRIR